MPRANPVELGYHPTSITVVIPTHRLRGYIRAAVDSALRQFTVHDELVIVANGCDDAYEKYLRHEFGNSASIMRIGTGGVANARNVGASEAQGSLLLFLDDDDELTDDALALHRAAFESRPGVAGVVGEVFTLGDEDKGHSRRFSTGGTRITAPLLLLDGPPSPSPGAAAFRRETFEALGGFRQDIAPADDWELWFRLVERHEAIGIAAPTLRYRFHDTRASLDISRMARSALKVLKENSAKLSGADEATVRARASMHFSRWYLPRQADAFIHNVRRGRIRDAMSDAMMATRICGFEFQQRLRRRATLRRAGGSS